MPFKDSERGETHCAPEFEAKLPYHSPYPMEFDGKDGGLYIASQRIACKEEFIGLILALTKQVKIPVHSSAIQLLVGITDEQADKVSIPCMGNEKPWIQLEPERAIPLFLSGLWWALKIQSKRKEGEKDGIH